MANCHKCYWADRHPETHVQEKHMEPDYLNQNMKPGQSPPDIRIVRSCGAGAKFFKNFGMQDHNCNRFEDESEAQAEEQAEIEVERAKWKHPTERLQLPTTQNMLLVIERMAAGSNPAYDILTDMMGVFGDELPHTLTHLDDMNIRGGQLVHALDWAKGDLQTLAKAAKERSLPLVSYVNQHFSGAKKERAVPRGAHLYGHKPSSKTKKK